MRTIICFSSLFLYVLYCNAQDYRRSGVYLTYDDFKTGELLNEFKPYQKNYSLWPQGFFKNKDIELKTPDTTVVYKRSDIWGYTDHQGRLIRVFNNNHYKVLCDKGLTIYIIYSPTGVSYHFSKNLNGPIYRLTKNNLKTIYAGNAVFLQRIESTKKKHLLFWDEKKKAFLLNEFFSEH